MATRETKIPSIPAVPDGLSEDMTDFLSALKERIEIREGRANDLDKVLLRRDLSKIGIDVNSLIKDPASYTFPNLVTGEWNYDIKLADGRFVKADEIRARDGDGLKLYEDGGAGIFVKDGGSVGIGTTSPDSIFHIKANVVGQVGSHPAGQLIIQDPDDTVFGNAVITGYESDAAGNPDQQLWYLGSSSSGNSNIIFLNRRNSRLQLGTNNASHLTILGNGNVGIGTTSPLAKLHIDQAVSDAAIPVLTLDQADESDGFINFIGSDRGVIAAETASLKSVRVELGGVVYRLALYVDA